MQNPLTPEQQTRLSNASSGLTTDQFSELSLAETNKIANQINQVLLKLHQESPFAFITTAYIDEKNKVAFQDKRTVGIPFSQYAYRK
ncbi:MAG: hypothetical protein WCI80_01405 [Bacteroidota bacterium]